MKSNLFILLFFICSFCFSQSIKNDSLWAVYENKSQPDTNRLRAIHALAWSYNANKPDTAILLAEKELELIQVLPEKRRVKWMAAAYNTIGVAYGTQGNYTKALENYFKSLKFNEETNNKKGIADSYSAIALVYLYRSNNTKSLEYYLKALKIYEATADKKGTGNCFIDIANIYLSYQANYPKALEYYLKGLKICEETGDKDGSAIGYSNIGIVYLDQKNYSKALEYFTRSLKIREELGDRQLMGASLTNIGIVYSEQGDFAKALDYFLKSLELKEKIGDKRGIGICFGNIADLYKKLSNYKLSLKYSNDELTLCKEIGDVDGEREAYQNLADVYVKIGKYKEAYENHVKYKQFTDSIFNSENSKQLGDMKTRFEVEKKEAELKIKSQAMEAINAEEKKKQQIIIYSVAGVLALMITFSLFLFNRFRITKRQKSIIEKQKVLVDHAYEELHEKNKEVMDSIYYARRIQRALITSEKYIHAQLERLMK